MLRIKALYFAVSVLLRWESRCYSGILRARLWSWAGGGSCMWETQGWFWFAFFKAALVPFIFKLRGCSPDDSFCK